MIRKIISAVVIVILAVGGYIYYLDATAPLETKLDSTDKIVYNAITKASTSFKNPASVRVVDGYIDYDTNTVYAKISAENGLGGHDSKVYKMDADGNIDRQSHVSDITIDLGKSEIKTAAAGYGKKNYGTFHCDKINEAYASHHK